MKLKMTKNKMARKKIEMIVRPDTIEENKYILRDLQSQKKIDRRNSKDLSKLFNTLNAVVKSGNTEKNDRLVALDSLHKVGTYGPIVENPPGSWWGIRVDCSRQGVHKPFNSNIHEGPFGAYSICTPQSIDSKDLDYGDFLSLTGNEFTESDSNGDPLIKNYRDCIPLRLVRSYSLSNEYSPRTGYRYDGLYSVIAHWIGDSGDSVKHHKFALARLPNQEPPPWLQSNSKSILSDESVKSSTKNYSCILRKRSPKLKKLSDCDLIDEKRKNAEKLNSRMKSSSSHPLNGISILTRKFFKKPNTNTETLSFLQSARTEASIQNSYTQKKTGLAKLQNTNISVRTDLYDSFHNLPQCKIHKSSALTKSSDKKHEEVKKFDDTLTVRHSSLPEKNIEKGNESRSALTDSVDQIGINWSSSILHERRIPLESNELRERNLIENNLDDNSSRICSSPSVSRSSESSKSLEALTPDKILNLVVKEKRNPMAKLLIGNVIGLSIEESKVIRAYNSLISKDSDVDKNVDNRKEHKQNTAPNFKMISKRVLRHHRNVENRINHTRSSRRKKGCTNVQKSGLNDVGYSKSIKIPNVTEVSKIKKSSGSKNQRREIANLAIDAKFGPLIRGPRNRRLRNQNLKRKGKDIDSFLCNSTLSRRRNMLNKQSKRSELLKRRKRLNGGITKVRKLQSANMNLKKRSKILETAKNLKEIIIKKKTEVQKSNVESSKNKSTKKSVMIDAVTQCSLRPVNSCLQSNSDFEQSPRHLQNNGRLSVVKIEEIDLDEVKSEDEESSFNDNLEIQNNGLDSAYNLYPLLYRESAFVPVNLSSSLRIVRLRSIGFRPIQTGARNDPDDVRLSITREDPDDVPAKDAGEHYNKYINEDTSDVAYMEDDLHYEDIENEDSSHVERTNYGFQRKVAAPAGCADMNTPCSMVSMDSTASCVQSCEKYKDSLNQILEENLERPWHGWKKISSKKGDQWIGW